MANSDSKLKQKYRSWGFSTPQFIWFIVGVLFWVGGLLTIVFGLLGDYASISHNPFKHASEVIANFFKFNLTLTWLGLIVLVIGSIIIALALNFAARLKERDQEKEARRNERRNAMKEKNSSIVLETNVTSTANEMDNK